MTIGIAETARPAFFRGPRNDMTVLRIHIQTCLNYTVVPMPPFHDVAVFWLNVFGVVGAVVALLLNWRAHAERASFEMIDRLYALCHTLEADLMKEWYLAHLFCIGDGEYSIVKSKIQVQVARESARFPELLIKEKLFAIQIFLIYEQVYYQWGKSSPLFHRGRRRFLGEILAYFHGRLFCNPRLVAILQSDQKGLSLHLEPATRAFIERRMARIGVPRKPDPDGPFIPTSGTNESDNSA